MAEDVLTARIKFDMGKMSGDTGSSTSASPGKGGNNLASGFKGILKALGPLAILASLKPIQDLLALILNFAVFGIIKSLILIWDWALAIGADWAAWWETGVAIWTSIVDWVKNVVSTIKEWFSNAITWIKELPGKIWTNIKEGFEWIKEKFVDAIQWIIGLPERIWGFIKDGFEWIKEKLDIVWEKIVDVKDSIIEWLGNAVDWIKNLPNNIWSAIKEGFQWIKDKVIEVWNSIKSLPQLIWDKIKALASLIATKIKEALPKNPFRRNKNVDENGEPIEDAIITTDGRVLKTHPNDTIIATQNPGGLGGGQKIFNFYGVTPQEMMDVIKKELASNVNRTSRL